MNAIKRKLLDLIADMSEAELAEVLDFAGYLRWRREREVFRGFLKASESSLEFWENEVDEGVWGVIGKQSQ
jgi:hypothetical protein